MSKKPRWNIVYVDNIPENYIGMNYHASKDLKLPFQYPENTLLIKSGLSPRETYKTIEHEKIEVRIYRKAKREHKPVTYQQAHQQTIEQETLLFNEYNLYRTAKRSHDRAQTDLAKYKESKDPSDKLWYKRHLSRSYYYRKKLSSLLGIRVTSKNIESVGQHEHIKTRHEEYLKTRRELKTRFSRTIKYKDKSGVTHKERVTYGFTSKDAVNMFKENVKRGYVPVPRGEDERRFMLLDENESSWNLHELVAIYRDGS